jgi:hypothetical protein
VERPHRCFLERAVHPLDLAIRPGVRLSQAMLNATGATNSAETVDAVDRRAGLVGELNPDVGQNNVNP